MNASNYIILGIIIVALIGTAIFFSVQLGINVQSDTGNIVSVPEALSSQVAPSVKNFDSSIRNFQYNPESIDVNFGDTVRVNIKNEDSVTHGISLPVFGVQEFVSPGAVKTIQFVADQRGNPETFCSTDHGEKLLINVN